MGTLQILSGKLAFQKLQQKYNMRTQHQDKGPRSVKQAETQQNLKDWGYGEGSFSNIGTLESKRVTQATCI